MNATTKVFATLIALVLGTVLTAQAQEESSVLVPEKTTAAESVPQPVLTPPANEPVAEAMPAPSNPAEQSPAIAAPASPRQAEPFLRPVEPRRVPATTLLEVTEEPMAAPLDPDSIEPGVLIDRSMEVRPAPPIVYDTDRHARRMYRESGEAHVVMIARNAADGCLYQIPMCIPGCCVGQEPTVTADRGLLGRGVVEFCWECGFTATVKFRAVLGDVKVEYDS